MELTIFCPPPNVQHVLALVNTIAESVLTYSKPDHFTEHTCTEGHGGHYVLCKAQVTLGIRCLSSYPYDVYVAPVVQYIWRVIY